MPPITAYTRPLNLHYRVLKFFLVAVDTPDPYVELFIPDTANGRKRTKIINDNKNPEWNETFKFVVDPELTNILRKWGSMPSARGKVETDSFCVIEDAIQIFIPKL